MRNSCSAEGVKVVQEARVWIGETKIYPENLILAYFLRVPVVATFQQAQP